MRGYCSLELGINIYLWNANADSQLYSQSRLRRLSAGEEALLRPVP